MGEHRHTPGPWCLDWYDPDSSDGHTIRMGTATDNPGRYEPQHLIEYNHGLFPCYEDGTPVEEGELRQYCEAVANAHLIAAAPDLLEACKTALEDLEATCDENGWTVYAQKVAEQLRAALRKARGGTDD